jgi:hypothetical protein
MRDRLAIRAGLAALLALAVAACGSSGASDNRLASKSASEIVARATRAIDAVDSVRVIGSVSDGAGPSAIKLDLNLVSGKGATGSMSQNGLGFRLVSVGDEAYINGSPGFWKQFGGSAAVRQLRGRWLRAPADRGEFASFHSLTDLRTLLAGLLGGHGALTKGSTATIDGRKVVAVKDASRNGTLYVSGPRTRWRSSTAGLAAGESGSAASTSPSS